MQLNEKYTLAKNNGRKINITWNIEKHTSIILFNTVEIVRKQNKIISDSEMKPTICWFKYDDNFILKLLIRIEYFVQKLVVLSFFVDHKLLSQCILNGKIYIN